MRVRNLNDLLVGCMLIAIALLALYLSRNLKVGTATDMGPGYVPRLLSGIQIALGAAIAATGFVRAGDPFEAWFVRPIFWVPASIVFFALTIEPLGLVVAVFGLVALSCVANRATRPLEAISLAVFMAALSALVFVVALGQTMAIWPPALQP